MGMKDTSAMYGFVVGATVAFVCIELVPSLSDKIPTHTHSENRPAVITTSPSAVVIATSGTTVAGIMLAD